MRPSLISAFTLLATAAIAEEKPTVHIGLSAPILNRSASYGAQMANTARAYVDWINGKGGILGHTVMLHIGDDECSPKSAVTVANDLVGKNIEAVFGTLCTSTASASRDVYREEEILQITLAQGTQNVTSEMDYPNLLRINVSNMFIARAMMDEVIRRGFKRISLLFVKDAYGTDMNDLLSAMAAERGIALTSHSYESDTKDFYAITNRMKMLDNVEAVLVAAYAPDMALFTRQLKEGAVSLPMIFSGTGTNTELASSYNCAGDEDVDITVIAAEDKHADSGDPDYEEFLSILEKYNQPLQESAYFTAKALDTWRVAVEKAGAFDTDSVRTALLSSDMETMFGSQGFVSSGDRYGHSTVEAVSEFSWSCRGAGPLQFGPR